MTATTAVRHPWQRPLRADARRNYERLLDAAEAAFTEQGADASLDDIARRAGVGIGTLYRHFPTRRALLEALLRDGIAALCTEADDLLTSPTPAAALASWLRAVVAHAATYRGLAAELLCTTCGTDSSPPCEHSDVMHAAGARLLARAQAAGEVRPDVDVHDLFAIVNGIAWVTEQTPGDRAQADRLLALMLDGLTCPQPTTRLP